MKTFLISVMLCFIGSQAIYAVPFSEMPIHSSKTNPHFQDPERRVLHVYVNFGILLFQCEGFSFCHLDFDYKKYITERPNSGGGIGAFEITPQGKLQIEFDPKSMDVTTLKTYFGSGIFIMDEDYELPADALKALDLQSYTVKTGRYPVTKTDTGGLLVTF